MTRPLLMAMLLTVAHPAHADAPVTGRPQHLTFARAPVQAAAAKAYRQTLARLAARHVLDTDRSTLARVRRLSAPLIAQAITLKPVAATWPWEIHVTSDPEVAAYSRAGGKLLIGTGFISRYHLSDDELTVALAHEVAHVIAEHVREQVSLAASFDPPPPNRQLHVGDVINAMESDIGVYFRLQPLSRLQELEADDIGVVLAARAGVAPAAIKGFYAKVIDTNDHQSVFDTHGPSRQREAFVMSMADYAEPVYEASRGTPLPRYAFR